MRRNMSRKVDSLFEEAVFLILHTYPNLYRMPSNMGAISCCCECFADSHGPSPGAQLGVEKSDFFTSFVLLVCM
eukprot:1414282-Amphidinium_carterae.1